MTGSILLFLFSACRENVDIMEVDVNIPDAQELGDLQLLGSVVDANEEGVLSVKVDLMQEGIILESTTTDRDGKYEMQTAVKQDQDTYVRASKEGFVTAMDVLESPSANTNMTTVLMPSEMLARGQTSTSETEFISLTGTIVDETGELQARKYVLLEDETGRISYATTNANGRFRLAAPLDTDVSLVVVDVICVQEEYRAAIGSFTENQDLGEIVIESIENPTINISGQLIDCNGMPLANGIVAVTSGNGAKQVVADGSGNFSLDITTCTGNRGVNVFAYDENFQNVSDAIDVVSMSGAVVLDPITVCTSGSSIIELTANGIDYTNNAAHTFLPNARESATGLNYIYPQNRRTGLTVYFAGASTGTFDANTFVYFDEDVAFIGGSRARNGTAITLTVTTYQRDLIEGTFEGQALNEETQVIEAVAGSFRIQQ